MSDRDFPISKPLVEAVSAWMALEAERDAMVREWQRLETLLMHACRARGLSFTWGHRSGLAAAQAMRDIDRRIRAAERRLDVAAGRMVRADAGSAEEALAKISLGLAVQKTDDWRPHARELLRGGIEEMGRLLVSGR